MGEIFVFFGLCEVEVDGVINYVFGGVWCRLIPMHGGKTILLEAAEDGGGVYEDVFWYDFSPDLARSLVVDAEADADSARFSDSSYYAATVEDYFGFFGTDVVRYYADDCFERIILGEGFSKIIRGGRVCYVKSGEEVLIWYDFAKSTLTIEVKICGVNSAKPSRPLSLRLFLN